ncbi:Uncharacterized protein TCM_027856 [Theobroma cacao]|uniref:Endonuclease/exonuclease/phosphatase domain-containing protein n=1 Tax=Theobroma cacao TaxID=3641 RepID=A0A061G9U3_THECC|nr:Uncharacterized protein TCM_027856 [Theobroma cacao]
MTEEKLSVIPPTRDSITYKDRPTAIFYEDEIQILARPFSNSIIGKFNRMPKLQEIRQEFKGIGLLAKTVGKPLYVDEATVNRTRPSVAQVCMEYDYRQPLVEEVWIVIQNKDTKAVTGEYSQKVEFSRMLNYYNHCCHVGHNVSDCLILASRSNNHKPGDKKAFDLPQGPDNIAASWDRKNTEERPTVTVGEAVVVVKKRKKYEPRGTGETESTMAGVLGSMEKDGNREKNRMEKQGQTKYVNSTPTGKNFSSSVPVDVKEKRESDAVEIRRIQEGQSLVLVMNVDNDEGFSMQLLTTTNESIEGNRELKPSGIQFQANEKSQMNDKSVSGSKIRLLKKPHDPTEVSEGVEKDRRQLLDKATMDVEESSDEYTCSNPVQEKRLVDHMQSPMQSHAESMNHDLDVHPHVSKRRKSDSSIYSSENWNFLNASEALEGPWMVGGDFNFIVSSAERLLSAPPHDGSMEDFATTLLNCGLLDVGFEGNNYTWTNNHMFRRLDRVVYNQEWAECFSYSRVQHLNSDGSDHCLFLISYPNTTHRGPSTFRFLHLWTKHHDFLPFVEWSWKTPMQATGMLAF